jgi:hypothetical protein
MQEGAGGIASFGDTGVSSSDAGIKWVERARPLSCAPEALLSADDGLDTTLKEYLARPMLVTTGSFAATDVSTTFTGKNLSAVLGANVMYANKMNGRYILRADLVLRLVVNADRFQAGRYILAGVPTGGDSIENAITPWYTMHRHSLTQITQLPHVELDINSQTEVELRLPWLSHFNGIPMSEMTNISLSGNPWIFFLYPYYPLITTAGSSTATYSLFLSLDNVTLGFPALPQMAISPTDVEQKKADKAPVSAFLGRISATFNQLSKIPVLSALAGNTAWGVDILRGAANIWGWSKPLDLAPLTRVRQDPHAYMATEDTVDTSMPLSLFGRNHVKILPGFGGTDFDEMSIDYLKAIPAYRGVFTWTTAAAANSTLGVLDVTPDQYTTTTETVDLTNYTPVGFVNSMFGMWRGSISYTLKFVSTMFHSGRLLIVYNPKYPLGSYHGARPDAYTSEYCYREIVDLREKHEVTFVVPFVSPFPWWNNGWPSLGEVVLQVLDPLIAPSTVSSSVPILVEVAGGPDLEFAVPVRNNQLTPTAPYTFQMDVALPSSEPILTGNIGGSTIKSDDLWNVEACVGEKILSLRSLLKRYSFWADPVASKGRRAFYPAAIDINVSSVGGLASTPVNTDDYNYISPCFLFSRGGFRIKSFVPGGGEHYGFVQLEHAGNSGSITSGVVDSVILGGLRSPGRPIQEVRTDLTGSIDIQVPMYHHTFARGNVANLMCSTASYSSSFSQPSSNHVYTTLVLQSNPTGGIISYRAGADDLNLGGFVSVPPMTL